MAKGTIALGQFRGKVGGQVLRVVDGQQIVQAYQPEIHDPKTNLQRCQRLAFAECVKVARALAVVTPLTFNKRPFQSALSKIYATGVDHAFPHTVEWKYPALQITAGEAGSAINILTGVPTWPEHLTLNVPLTNIEIGGKYAAMHTADSRRFQVRLVAYCPDLGMAIASGPMLTSATAVQVKCPTTWDGMEIEVYVFIRVRMGEGEGHPVSDGSYREEYLPYETSKTFYCGHFEVE